MGGISSDLNFVCVYNNPLNYSITVHHSVNLSLIGQVIRHLRLECAFIFLKYVSLY